MNQNNFAITDLGILTDIAYSAYDGSFIQNHVQNNLPLTTNEKGTFTLSTSYTVIDYTPEGTQTGMQALLLAKDRQQRLRHRLSRHIRRVEYCRGCLARVDQL